MQVEFLKGEGRVRVYHITLTEEEIIGAIYDPLVAIDLTTGVQFILFPGDNLGDRFRPMHEQIPTYMTTIGTDHQGKPAEEWELSDLVETIQNSPFIPLTRRSYFHGEEVNCGAVILSVAGQPTSRSFATYDLAQRLMRNHRAIN